MRKKILTWYNKNQVQYPWRNESSVYKVWLSEVMLQQTQVKTVTPYYLKWISNYPNINSVAEAHQEDLLKQWEGLGYYARVRNFHSACKVVVSQYKSIVPADNQFRLLPGVGDYIDAAVRSICFNIPRPVIDGNVKRIMSRYLQLSIIRNTDLKKVTTFLTNEIDLKNPGNFNQALMDLGRFICKPKKPLCNECPIKTKCLSFINNTTQCYPVRINKKRKPHYEVVVGIIWKNDKILISKRKQGGLLGGLWEFPGGKMQNNETKEECIRREVKEELNININPYQYINSINHAYSHFSISMHAFHCHFISGSAKAVTCDKFMWTKVDNIVKLPFPKANHKIFNDLPCVQP
mgnify:CR=1 FL=1